MKILIVGAWQWSHYEKAFSDGLVTNGAEVAAFSVMEFFRGRFGHIQQAIPFPGPAMIALNSSLVREVSREEPDCVLFWKPTHIFPSTIRALSEMGIYSLSYNNDDPFAPEAHGNVPWHHHFLWLWYKRCLPYFHLNFFYRKINCNEARFYGAEKTELLLPYFLPWRDREINLSWEERLRYQADAVFVGHYEPDGRAESIRALVMAGIQVKVWGGRYWTREVLGDVYDKLKPIVPVEGDEYPKALSGAKVCLCFLSSLNRDSYTRRCFEIPACGKVLLAERTDELLKFFKEDEEACYFSSDEELVRKVKWLLANPEIREKIAQSGLERVWRDGHDVNSRARGFLRSVELLYHAQD